MKEFESNGLERLFKSRIERGVKSDESWNEPSIEIFNEAIERVNAQDKGRKRFLIPIFLGFLLLTLSGLGVAHFSTTVDKLDSKVENIELEINNLKSKNTAVQSLITDQSSTDEATIENLNTIQKASSILDKDDKLVYSKSSTANDKRTVDLKFQSQFDGNPTITKQEKFVTNNVNRLDYGNSSNVTNDLVQMRASSGLELVGSYQKASINILKEIDHISISSILGSPFVLDVPPLEAQLNPSLSAVVDNNIVRKNKIQMHVYAGFNFSKMCIDDMQNMRHQDLSSYSDYNAGRTIGAHFQYNPLQRISIIAGLSRHKINRYSHLTSQSDYEEQFSGVNDQGELMYKMPMDLVTPIGTTNVTAEYRLNNLVAENSTAKLNMNSDINQELLVNTIALGLKYYPYSKGDISYFIAGIANNNFIQKTNSIVNSFMMMEKKEMGSMQSEFDSVMPKTKHYLSLQTEVGLEYNLLESIGVQVSGAYDLPLNSIKLIDSNLSPKTHTKLINLKAGLVFKL